mgnify:CR=1 FL=1
MIDVHTHVLVAIDDGAQDLDVSLDMLRAAELSGVTDIIATPHVIEKHTALKWQQIVSLVDELQAISINKGINIKIHPGAELEMNWDILDILEKTDGIAPYGLAGSQYLLVELPASMIPSYADDFWFEVRMYGMTPVLAHPERHTELMSKPHILERWKKEGLLLQCNTSSLTGLYGSTIKRNLEYLIERDYVDFVASDAHNNKRRNTDVRECLTILESRYGNAYKNKITQIGQEKILADAKMRTQKNKL